MEYYLAKKKKEDCDELLIVTWVDLQNIMSERNQNQKSKSWY